MATRVLIIGRHTLFHDGLSHLLIVDHDSAALREADLAPLLENEEQDIKVIYLTLAQNKMVIHNRQQVTDVTATDLLQALQSPNIGAGVEESDGI